MHPKDRAQMIAYMLRPGIKDKVKFASDIAKTVDKFEVQQIKLFNRFNRDYPNKKADGGMLVKPSADGSRPGYNGENLDRAAYKKIRPITKANIDNYTYFTSKEAAKPYKYKVQLPTESGVRYRTELFKTKKAAQKAIDGAEITNKDYIEGLIKTKLPKGATVFDKGRVKIPTGEFVGTGRDRAEIFIIRNKDGTNPKYTAAGAGGKRKLFDNIDLLKREKLKSEKISKAKKIDYFNPTKTELENTLKDLYKNPKIKKIINRNKPLPKDFTTVAKILKTTESSAQTKLSQLFDAMNPDGTTTIEGIPKINKNKANLFQNFYQKSKVPKTIIDTAIGQSVGEKPLSQTRQNIQTSLQEAGIEGADTDEARARSVGYRMNTKPYSIFGQVIKSKENRDIKRGWDAVSQKLEENVQNAISEFGENSEQAKLAKDRYNSRAVDYEKLLNKNLRKGALKIRLPKITFDDPSKAIKNKAAYEKYKSFFDKNFAEQKYSFEIAKDLKPLPQIDTELKKQKNITKAKEAFDFGDARMYANPFFSPGVLKEAFKTIPTPLGAVGLTAGFGVDPTSAIDRASIAAESAFAPQLVKQSAKFGPVAQRIFNLGLTPAMAARVARIASPLGIASLGAEGLYQAGKFTKKRMDELKAMSPEQRQQLRAEQSALAFEGARDGGLIGKKSGPPPISGPTPHGDEGLPGIFKRGKKG